jgi:hypothetical protein
MKNPPSHGDDNSYEHVGVIDPAHLCHLCRAPGSAPTTGNGIPTSSPWSKQHRAVIAAFAHHRILLPPVRPTSTNVTNGGKHSCQSYETPLVTLSHKIPKGKQKQETHKIPNSKQKWEARS